MSVQRRSDRTRDDVPGPAKKCETLIAYGTTPDQRREWVAEGKQVTVVPDVRIHGAIDPDREVWISTNADDLVHLEEHR